MIPVAISCLIELKTLGYPTRDGHNQRDVAINALLSDKLIVLGPPPFDTGKDYLLTERGEAYFRFLTELPPPQANWVLPVAFSQQVLGSES